MSGSGDSGGLTGCPGRGPGSSWTARLELSLEGEGERPPVSVERRFQERDPQSSSEAEGPPGSGRPGVPSGLRGKAGAPGNTGDRPR